MVSGGWEPVGHFEVQLEKSGCGGNWGWGWVSGLRGRLPEEGNPVSRGPKAALASAGDLGGGFYMKWGLEVSWSACDDEGEKES